MVTRNKADRPVQGSVHPATPDGFSTLLSDANLAHERGMRLVAIVPMGARHIGAVFVRDKDREAQLV